ncbi:hypothetical protein Ddye_027410 [Dipteronia dyeriana]|uniref:Leucine-rich repeat-containing N-terminal plant-type domain-containing protein n=1 Tax=Dipteronia dyeriana TaxID=168575 RepID=A0AAD9WRG2_9ROSI|nr:hypothetical protein Ddye_027410 [Dipteronia dyeriana]
MSTLVVLALLLFLHLLAIFTTTKISFFCNGSTYVGCIESERQALMRFKQDLTDPSNRLDSWNNIIDHGDCCANWVGVVCDKFTGHVLELHLRNPVNTNPFTDDVSDSDEYGAYERSMLGGKINPSLLDLKHLIYLDLSNNDFQGTQIPGFFSFMRNLRYLNLSGAGFMGMIPHQLGNLSNLQYLGLGQNYWDILRVENLSWLSGLSRLKHLDLSVVDLSKSSDWLLVINKLPSLEVLRLSGCQLHHFPPLSTANFSSLAILDLSNNQFDSSLTPSWIFGLSDLVFLDLHTNIFKGSIPDGLQNLTRLRHLDLSDNHFNSSIPNWLCKFGYLEDLSLSYNRLLRGTISSDLEDLTSSIKTLDLSFTRIEGRIPRSFGRLCKLKSVILSEVKLSQEISEVLDIFSGCVSHGLEALNLDSSQLSGLLTNQLQNFKNLNTLRLRNNSISCPIPLSLGELSSLISFDLSYNKLNGPIPFSLGKLSSLRDLSLSYNKLDSHIPLSLGQLSSLRNLDLSYNKLVGNLFEIHLANLTRLTNFVVSGNSLVLKVGPNWVPPFQLERLHLSSCHIGPQIPLWLHSQKSLFFLEISNSRIVDAIPSWFGNYHPNFFT